MEVWTGTATGPDWCGTVGCIAGWAADMAAPGPEPWLAVEDYANDIPELAAAWLGLRDDQADALFAPDLPATRDATPTEAAAVLRLVAGRGAWFLRFRNPPTASLDCGRANGECTLRRCAVPGRRTERALNGRHNCCSMAGVAHGYR